MNTKKNLWRVITGRDRDQESGSPTGAEAETSSDAVLPETANQALEITPNDPLLTFMVNSPGVVEIDKLAFDSPAVAAMRAAGVKIAVPLISHGDLVGILNLGPRLSEQDYNPDDTRLLENLAGQAAPALRVAQLARQQQAEARERERMEQELRVASLIQHTLLPRQIPELPGWQIAAYYQPARAVGGDFYDFLEFEDGQFGLVIGDVTDKGVPAAMVMATTRSILRAATESLVSPGAVLQRANNLLVQDIPPNMFVTCLYVLLDLETGRLCFANAGHDLPYRREVDGISELRATGMPLGLMPDMTYEEKEISLEPGETVLFYSDGLVEAHNPHGEMYGFPRLRGQIASHAGGPPLIDYLLGELVNFTGEDWEQEDDVALITLTHLKETEASPVSGQTAEAPNHAWRTLAEFQVASEPGNERQAILQLEEALKGTDIPVNQLERLKTAVGEATMNAMEHGNKFQPDVPVLIKIESSEDSLRIKITDKGGGEFATQTETPDLEAKLAGEQSPRGWGLFLIKNMVDDMSVSSDKSHHTIELKINLKGEQSAGESTTP